MFKKNKLCFLGFIFLLVLSISSFSLANVDDEVKEIIKNAPASKHFPTAGAIILLDRVKVVVNPDSTTTVTEHEIIKILNDRGIKSYGEIRLSYASQFQQINVDFARTFKPDGTIVYPSKEAINDVSSPTSLTAPVYSDVRYKVISMPALQNDAVIEYKVTTKDLKTYMKDRFWAHTYTQGAEPVMRSEFIVVVPKGMNFNYATKNISDLKPLVISSDVDKTDTYIWQVNNSSPILKEPGMPTYQDLVGKITVSSIKSWDEVSQWYYDNACKKMEDTPEIKLAVQRIIADKTDKMEKIKAIYYYVISQNRYVGFEFGMGGYVPRSAIEVFKSRQGDCKDLSTLLITMLKSASIKAYPVLISTVNRGKVEMDIPNPGQFDHLITAVPLENGKFLWLDSTIETCSFGDLPYHDQGRDALVIMEDGKGKFYKTPFLEPEINQEIITSKVTIKKDGTVENIMSIAEKGIFAMTVRSLLRSIQPELRYSVVKSVTNRISPGANVISYEISNLEDLDQPLIVNFGFTCPFYAKIAGDLLILKMPLPPNLPFTQAIIQDPGLRHYSYVIGYNLSSKRNFEVVIPEGYKVRNLQPEVTITRPFGSFRLTSKLSPDKKTVQYNSEVIINKPVIPLEEYGALKEFVDSITREEEQLIVFIQDK